MTDKWRYTHGGRSCNGIFSQRRPNVTPAVKIGENLKSIIPSSKMHH